MRSARPAPCNRDPCPSDRACPYPCKAEAAAPIRPSSPTVTLMCMKILRRLSLGLMARMPPTHKRQAKPRRNQRRGMNGAAGAEKAYQPENDQQNAENNRHLGHAALQLLCMARITVASCQCSVISVQWPAVRNLLIFLFPRGRAASRIPWTRTMPGQTDY